MARQVFPQTTSLSSIWARHLPQFWVIYLALNQHLSWQALLKLHGIQTLPNQRAPFQALSHKAQRLFLVYHYSTVIRQGACHSHLSCTTPLKWQAYWTATAITIIQFHCHNVRYMKIVSPKCQSWKEVKKSFLVPKRQPAKACPVHRVGGLAELSWLSEWLRGGEEPFTKLAPVLPALWCELVVLIPLSFQRGKLVPLAVCHCLCIYTYTGR